MRRLSLCLFFLLAFAIPVQARAAKPISVTPQQLERRIKHDPSLLIADVRSRQSFQRRHLKGAASMPLVQISQWAPKLKPNQWIALYCACPHDEMSLAAAKLLVSRYHHTRSLVLHQGIDGWIADGYPFEESENYP